MIRNLIPDGDHHLLEIPLEVLEAINATVETEFDVKIVGQTIVITPVRDADRDRQFDEDLKDVHDRFGNALRKLGE